MTHTSGCHNHRGREGVPVLTYFDVKGYAEPIRILFNLGNVHFVDRRIKDQEEFEAKWKAYSPTGLVPILEVDGEVLCESQSILLYAAKRAGFFPENPQDQDKALSILSVLVDFNSRGAAIPTSVPREERYAMMKQMWNDNVVPMYTRVEALFEPSANGWIVGDRLSFIDIAIYHSLDLAREFGGEKAAGLDQHFTKIAKVYNAVLNHPGVAAHRAKSTPSKPKLYYFNMEGIAAPIRWMFAIGGIDYQDVRVERQDWPELKKTIPGGVMPALQLEDGTWLTESSAIAVHVARMTGMMPHRDSDFAHAYSVVLATAPLGAIARSVMLAESPEAAAAAKKIAYEETIPALYRRLEGIVALRQSKQGYVVGDKLSFGDLFVAYAGAAAIDGWKGIVPNMLKDLPCCNKVTEIVINHPAVKKERLGGVVCTPKLSYFDIPGRAEHIRQMLKYGKVEFEDFRPKWPVWSNELKAQSVTGVMPYLDIGDLRIYEIIGCLQYVAELVDLVPRTWKGRSHALAIFSVQQNVHQVVLKHYAAPAGDERKAKAESLRPEYLVQLGILEKMVAQHQSVEGYCVDNQLTYIDFYVAHEISYNKDTFVCPEDWQTNHPALAKIYNLVKALEI